MAMTTCRECKAQISTTAESCPQCGAKPKKTSGCVIVLLAFLGLFVFASMMRGCADSKRDDVPMPTSTASDAPASAGTTPAPAPEPAKRDPVAELAESTRTVDEVDARIKENDAHLKKFYASPERVTESTADLIKLAVVKGYYEASKVKEEKALSRRADALIKTVTQQQRRLYASSLEEIFVKNGFDVDVSAAGNARDQLRLKYVLMSKPLVYKFQNEMELQEQARLYGFKRIVYSDGYDESWTVDL